MKTISSIAMLLILLLWIPSYSQKKQLSLNLAKGETYHQMVVSNTAIVQSMGEQDQKMNITISGKVSFKVNGVANSVYDMEVQYENLSMKMVTPQGAMDFSSEKKDESDIFSKILSQMKNKAFQVLMYNNGRVKEIKGTEILFNNMFEQMTTIPDAQKAQLKSQLQAAYGDKAFKGNIEMSTAIFPDEKVAKGDTWAIKTQLEAGMAIKVESSYKYADVGDTFYQLQGTSTMASADKEAYVESGGMPVRYDLTGSMTSDIKVDKKTGWVVEAKINQKLTGKADIKDTPAVPGGMTIPMTLTTDMTVTDK